MSGAAARSLRGGQLVLASHNAGKVREIAELLAPFDVRIVSAGELGLPEPAETGSSFADNAIIKAVAAARAVGLPAISDDSGLAVDALGGAPGIYSARWAGGGGKDFAVAMARVEREVTASARQPSRRAHFVCALALCWPAATFEGTEICRIFEGRVDGHVVWPPRGTRGFGYDPIFMADGRTETFGEMDPAVKHASSHRADAFRKLIAAVFPASAAEAAARGVKK